MIKDWSIVNRIKSSNRIYQKKLTKRKLCEIKKSEVDICKGKQIIV